MPKTVGSLPKKEKCLPTHVSEAFYWRWHALAKAQGKSGAELSREVLEQYVARGTVKQHNAEVIVAVKRLETVVTESFAHFFGGPEEGTD